jgi:uncharacterized protein (DUF433 family)
MKAEGPTYLDRITQDPNIMVGKPVVRGTRIPVERVLAHLADNPDMDDLFEAFPHLKLEDVKACLAYARLQLRQAPRLSYSAVLGGRPRRARLWREAARQTNSVPSWVSP